MMMNTSRSYLAKYNVLYESNYGVGFSRARWSHEQTYLRRQRLKNRRRDATYGFLL